MNVLRALCAAAMFAATGCQTARFTASPTQPRGISHSLPVPASEVVAAPLALTAFQEPLPPVMPPGPPPVDVLVENVLSRQWLAAEIEARHPSLEAMAAAWRAAMQRYPQQIALDNPMLMGMIAPESAGSAVTETAYAFQLNQKLPWFGKRNLRGAAAAADADAASQDLADTRLQVRLAADLAFFEYFLVERQSALNLANERLMEQFRDTAQGRYQARLAQQQDVLLADLELGELQRRRLEISRMQRVAIARINTLLRRWPDAPLPPPPAELDPPQPPADSALLWQTALQQRPDLAALAWRVQSEEAALALARKNYYPDVDLFGRYDTFWQPASTQGPLRAQIGVGVDLPVYREKLRAAVCEAQFRLAQRRAEFDARAQEIQYEVISAAEQVSETQKAIELFQRLISTAELNVATTRANYQASRGTFLELSQAQRQFVALRERQLDAVVTYHRRLAELDRAIGVADLR